MTDEADWLRRYDPAEHPPFAVTVDLAVFTLRSERLHVLLVRRGVFPHRGSWALPGGHVIQGRESAHDAAHRELLEETGVDARRSCAHLEQLGTYSEPGRDPRMIAGLQVVSIAFVALAPELPEAAAGTDAEVAEWTAVSALPELAFDHDRILSDALDRIRAQLEYTSLALHFVDESFTMAQLRRVYEAVWDQPLDAANFRRKILATPGLVIPTETTAVSPGSRGGRPAELYRRGGAQHIAPAFYRPAAASTSR